jgi:hypothetical protein
MNENLSDNTPSFVPSTTEDRGNPQADLGLPGERMALDGGGNSFPLSIDELDRGVQGVEGPGS